MEEAYTELYQQFLRLRSLCLKQAALLNQLTTALQKQKDINVLNNDLSHLTSIPVQCTQELPVYFHKKPQPLSAASHNSEAQCHLNGFCQKAGTVSDVLAEDMSKLSMDWPQWREECKKLEQWRAPLPSKWKGACFSDSKTSGQAVQTCSDRTLHTAKMPMSDSPSHLTDFLSQSGGLLMSDVSLQSHVCDFCQAVFPGDTTTKGEFLRHLHTHIT
ncbi:uncharacterized protein LOC103386019 [Cynoglossus semilaevis]|uniref:Uncharacterized LOC103386019 n=1 Tax=Cynoglossus semilaevis TaxID=244447 RepID=A0A3P8V0R9_CYNSE|nr:uncharacterized protein LOC103386019 [Cynoglossus semilaevis]XP_008318315.1 uncharacterized protein LOC103386019 [Cynoglossus semilaevis]XP_024915999.1 uncharacterized protein LOC103386019 [Cynoglossus semilaevis]